MINFCRIFVAFFNKIAIAFCINLFHFVVKCSNEPNMKPQSLFPKLKFLVNSNTMLMDLQCSLFLSHLREDVLLSLSLKKTSRTA